MSKCPQCLGTQYYCYCCMWSPLPWHKEELSKRLEEYKKILDKKFNATITKY